MAKIVDTTTAFGVARRLRQTIEADESAADQAYVSTVNSLIRHNLDGRKIAPAAFNVAVASYRKHAAARAATFWLNSAKSSSGRHALTTHGLIRAVRVTHHARDAASKQNYQSLEYSPCLMRIETQRGCLGAESVNLPVLYDQHLIRRLCERGGVATPADFGAVVQSSLPLALQYLQITDAHSNRVTAQGVNIPVDGGVLCGGIEAVHSPDLALCFDLDCQNYRIGKKAVTDAWVQVVSLRTFMDDALLCARQQSVNNALRRHQERLLGSLAAIERDPLNRVLRKSVDSLQTLAHRANALYPNWTQQSEQRGRSGMTVAKIITRVKPSS